MSIETIIRDYTEGRYGGLCRWSQHMAGGRGAFEAQGDMDFGLEAIPEETRRDAELLYGRILAADEAPIDLVRTEVNRKGGEDGWGRAARYGTAPGAGATLRWGVKSASFDPGWVAKLANEEIPGMRDAEGRTLAADGAEIVAYHRGARRYLRIDHLSEWDQSEALVGGAYRVAAVERGEAATGIPDYSDPIRITPRQQAAAEGAAIERFTSKRGEDCIRYGNHVRRAGEIDEPVVSTGSCRCHRVPVTHIYLEEVHQG